MYSASQFSGFSCGSCLVQGSAPLLCHCGSRHHHSRGYTCDLFYKDYPALFHLTHWEQPGQQLGKDTQHKSPALKHAFQRISNLHWGWNFSCTNDSFVWLLSITCSFLPLYSQNTSLIYHWHISLRWGECFCWTQSRDNFSLFMNYFFITYSRHLKVTINYPIRKKWERRKFTF